MSLTFMGRQYKIDDVRRDTVSTAKMLAKNARLEQPLPTDVDLSESEHEELQIQLAAMLAMPPFLVTAFWSAVIAHHIGALASALRTLSLSTQRKAVSSLIQILSLLPQPVEDPYFRKFLTESSQSNGLPNLIAAAFVSGIDWMRPSGPGHICILIANLILWCDASQSDDGKAPINADIRAALAAKVTLMIANQRFHDLDEAQGAGIRRLHGLLSKDLDKTFLASIQATESQSLYACAKPSCAERGEFTCTACKSVRYCGKTCQTWHWKNGHKLRCFQATY